MFSFLGLRKDSKKSTPDKEVDGGFVIIGKKMKDTIALSKQNKSQYLHILHVDVVNRSTHT